MQIDKAEQASRYLAIQILLLLFSFIFFFVIAYGYFHLLIEAGWFVALVGGSIVAAIAWFLGRWIGTTPGGPWSDGRNYFLMAILLIISAAGVYNTMMVYIEGEQVLADTAIESQETFNLLGLAADAELQDTEAVERTGRIDNLKESLFSEMRNPRNCGEGPEARRIIRELQRELPGFSPLSGGGNRRCENIEEIVDDYDKRIEGLKDRAEWNQPVLVEVSRGTDAAKQQLEGIRSDINANYSAELIGQYVSNFDTMDGQYRDLRAQLGERTDVDGLPQELPLVAAESLGNVYKIIPLFLSRITYPSTWVYLIMAIIFDLLLVSLFSIVTDTRLPKVRDKTPLKSGM